MVRQLGPHSLCDFDATPARFVFLDVFVAREQGENTMLTLSESERESKARQQDDDRSPACKIVLSIRAAARDASL